MPGTAGSRPRARDTQAMNAQNPRAGRGDHAQPNMGQYGQHTVHAEPVATAGFSWERATKVQ